MQSHDSMLLDSETVGQNRRPVGQARSTEINATLAQRQSARLP
jgi:hypothetical protein